MLKQGHLDLFKVVFLLVVDGICLFIKGYTSLWFLSSKFQTFWGTRGVLISTVGICRVIASLCEPLASFDLPLNTKWRCVPAVKPGDPLLNVSTGVLPCIADKWAGRATTTRTAPPGWWSTLERGTGCPACSISQPSPPEGQEATATRWASSPFYHNLKETFEEVTFLDPDGLNLGGIEYGILSTL